MQKFVSLNQNKDFLRLYYRGKSCAKPAVVVYAMKNRAGVFLTGFFKKGIDKCDGVCYTNIK